MGSGEGGVRLGLYKEKEREAEGKKPQLTPRRHGDIRNACLDRSDFAVPTLGTAVFLAFWYSCTIF